MTGHSKTTDFMTFFRLNHLMMLIINSKTNQIFDANPAACRFYGYAWEEINKLFVTDIDITSAEALKTEIEEAMREGRNYLNLKHRLSSGEIRDVLVYSGSVNPNLDGLMYLIIDDVTIQKEKSEALRKNEERLAFALESNGDGVWDYDVKSGSIFYSKVWKEILGYGETANNIEKIADWEQRIHPEDRERVLKEFHDHLEGKTPIYNCEYRIRMDGVSYVWILDRGKAVARDETGRAVRMVGTDTDITERKEMEIEKNRILQELRKRESEILFLSLHDELTGLPNRRYLSERLETLNKPENMPLTILIGDVNGLKLTNDIFGHSEGDQILIKAANVMRKSCREGDLIARWGGDEFVVVLPKTTAEEAEHILRRIKFECDEAGEDEEIGLSISLGFSTKEQAEIDSMITLKMAEDMMYTSKLLENRSLRSSLINSMKNSLHEKSHETEQHASRLSAFCQRVALRMNVPESQLDELKLFSVLHDIGKIAVRDEILNKPGPLSEREWIEMRRHSEIGYHIAKSAPELTQIAEYILCHHERWDGKGYPRGLKGTDIPLFSRILAVVDAFDAMTSDRPYKKSISEEAAREELRRNAGTQFDPAVVESFVSVTELPYEEE